MSTRDALLAAVRADLDDDLPRLVFADWLEENGHAARAAFIRRQCRLAQVRDTNPDYFDLKHELCLNPPDPKWLSELPPRLRKVRHVYRRGFVDELNLTAKKFVADGAGLFDTTAVRVVTLSGVRGALAGLVDCLPLGGVRELNLHGNKVGDAVSRLLYSPLLNAVRALNLGATGLTPAGAAHLGQSKDLPHLARLNLSGCNLHDVGVERLVTHHRAGLAELDVSNCNSGPRALRAIASGLPHLRSLNFSGNRLTEKTAAALLAGDAFPALTALDLFTGYMPSATTFPAWGELVRAPLFRRLTELKLDCDEVPDADWQNLPDDVGPPGLALHFQSRHHGTNLRLAESPLLARCTRLLVRVPDAGEDVLRAVAENPAAALRGLAVLPAWGGRPPGLGRTLATLAAAPHLANLLDFWHWRPLTDEDVVTLSRATFAGELRRLTINADGLTAKGLAMLADPAAFPKLRNLGVNPHGLELRQPTAAQALRERFGAGFGWSW